MSGAAPDGVRRLPYPHARNDCMMCRERDADFHVPARDLPSGYRALYCRRCIGEFMITEAAGIRNYAEPPCLPVGLRFAYEQPSRQPGNLAP